MSKYPLLVRIAKKINHERYNATINSQNFKAEDVRESVLDALDALEDKNLVTPITYRSYALNETESMSPYYDALDLSDKEQEIFKQSIEVSG